MSTSTSTSVDVTLIVPVYNGDKVFETCLQNVLLLNPAPRQFIVVDDGSTDGSWALAQAAGAEVLNSPAPKGPAHARNLGARHAQGEILYFVDADVALPSDTLTQIVSAFRQEPALTALIGSYDDAPAASNFLSQYKNLLHHYIHQTSNEEASTFWGACGAIRRDVFLKMGGFDESYGRPSIEDIELGYRLKRAGYQIRLRKSLQVKHLKRWTARSLVQTDFFQRALPWSRLLLQDAKNGSDFGNDLNLQASSRISALLVLLLPGALAFTPWFGIAGITAFTATITLLWLNLPLYRFLQRKRGIGFALRTIPWHWFYYFYSSLALGFAYLEKLFTNNTRSFFANNSFSPDRKSRKE